MSLLNVLNEAQTLENLNITVQPTLLSRIPKNVFAYLAMGAFSVFLLLFILGDTGIFFARLGFYLFGPILWFVVAFSVAFYFGYKAYKNEKALKPVIIYLLISATATILLAFVINTRFVFVATIIVIGLAQFFPINLAIAQLSATLLFAAVLVPICEEIVKAIPLLILARGFITERGKQERRIFRSPAVIALSGVMSAGIFTLTETYLYISRRGNLNVLNQDDTWVLIAPQILIRSFMPLHYGTVGIVVIGLAFSLYKQNKKILKFSDFYLAFIGLGGAIVLHALWNGTIITYFLFSSLFGNIYIFGVLPLPNAIYGIISVAIMAFVFLRLTKYEYTLCESCGEWHQPPFTPDAHKKPVVVKTGGKLSAFLSNRLKKCNLCKRELNSTGECVHCFKTDFFSCKNCLYPVPTYTSVCWNCDFEIKPIYTQVFQFRNHIIDSLATGLTFVFAGFYLVIFSVLLIDTFQNENSILPPDTILLLFMLGLVYAILAGWLIGNRRRAEAIAMSRTLFASVIFILGITPSLIFFFVGISFMANFGMLSLFFGFVLLIFGALCFLLNCYITVSIAFGFIPVFKGEIE